MTGLSVPPGARGNCPHCHRDLVLRPGSIEPGMGIVPAHKIGVVGDPPRRPSIGDQDDVHLIRCPGAGGAVRTYSVGAGSQTAEAAQ